MIQFSSIWTGPLFVAWFVLVLSLEGCSSDPDVLSSTGDGAQNPVDSGQLPDTSTSPNDDKYVWFIHGIQDGGPGKDGIYALVEPPFESVAATSYLQEDDLVVGIKVGNIVKAYSHRILDWHEIVNDKFDRRSIAITYRPLTGSGVGFDIRASLEVATATTFGVSGFLWNNNLIPYDRLTDSNWSQMLLWCVNGRLRGQLAVHVPLVETTWATWKKMFPNSLVLSNETGFDRPYHIFPYGNYKTDPFLLFPISFDDKRLPRKARVHGIILGRIERGRAKAYPFDLFQGQIRAINDEAGTQPVVVAGSGPDNIIVSYSSRSLNGTRLQFDVKT
ncbi:MAG: DUF3179 domain-containing (seleno)protein, partial [Bacteroidota bacterium]